MLSFSVELEQKWSEKMARIAKRTKKNGVSYQATVRRKGFPTVSRTFDTRGDASLVKLLRTAVEQSADEDGWSHLGRVGQYISNKTS